MKKILIIIVSIVSSTSFSKTLELGDYIYPNFMGYEFLDYSPSTQISTYLYTGIKDDLYLFELEINEIVLGVKNNKIISINYNLISNESNGSNELYRATELYNHLNTNKLIYIINNSFVLVENNFMVSLASSNNNLTFNNDRIVYSKISFDGISINNSSSDNNLDSSKRLSYALMGLPKMLEYSRSQIAFNNFEVDYYITGCEVLPMYIDHNREVARVLEERHGKYWKELHHQYFIKEMYNWTLIQDLVKMSYKFKSLKNRFSNLHMYTKSKGSGDYLVKINRFVNTENGFKDITIAQYTVNTKTKNIEFISEKIIQAEIDDEEFGSRVYL